MSWCPTFRLTRELQFSPKISRAQMASPLPMYVSAIPSLSSEALNVTKRLCSTPAGTERENKSISAKPMQMTLNSRAASGSFALSGFIHRAATAHTIAIAYQGSNSICPSMKACIAHSSLLHSRIGRAENTRRAVLPDPGMDHPLRETREAATLFLTLVLSQIALHAPVWEDAKIR